MGIVVLILASSRKWISGLFWTTGHTRMHWRAVLEQLLIFNITGWSVDAAAPTVPHSASLQDTQILPGELCCWYCWCFSSPTTTAFVLVMTRRSWTGIFGAALSPVFTASPGKELPLLQNAGVGCTHRVHTCIQAFPDLLLWLRMCLRFAPCIFHSCVSAVKM